MRKRPVEPDEFGVLRDLQVVVSRPRQQAQRLADMLAAKGANPLLLPTLQIEPLPCSRRTLDTLSQAQIAIFISPNAVTYGLDCVEQFGQWPVSVCTLAVGPGTRDVLQERGIRVETLPESFNTNGLLAHQALSESSVRGKRVAIFRGLGGLATLGEQLVERGALVSYCEVYRRRRVKKSPISVNLRGTRGEIDIIVATSGEVLRSLVDLLDSLHGDWLRLTPLVVASERVAQVARDLQWQAEILVAPSATDSDVMATLVAWCRERKETTG